MCDCCYACLTLVLPWLQGLEELAVEPQVSEDRFAALAAQCQSGLERGVLAAIRDRGLPLPDEAQKTIYDGDEPLASVDFYYEPRIVVFVDGSPHHRDYVAAADERKRRRLKALGYRILAVAGDGLEEALATLEEWLDLRA